MIAEVYDALKSTGADEDKARAAATAVSGQLECEARLTDVGTRIDRLEDRLGRAQSWLGKVETDPAVLKWMVGANVALTMPVPGKLLIP